ncbi:MAG: PTS galactitol transporter subunit IIC, partial [Klebsiella sp.]|nr:PTS galactitol transporter subunit IIC [Klebsiella sp.]
QGGSPITWLLIQLFTWQNVVGFAVIGIIYLTGVLLTWRRARRFIAVEKAEKSAAPQQSTGMS